MPELLYTRDIKAELMRIGSSPAAIARELGVHRVTVTRWVNGLRDNPLVRHYVAAKLGRRPDDLRPGCRSYPPDRQSSGNGVAGATSDYTSVPPAPDAEEAA